MVVFCHGPSSVTDLFPFRKKNAGNLIIPRSRDSSVVIVTGYGLDVQGSIPGRGKRFSLLRSVQTRSEAHPVSYSMATGGKAARV
jgi:hypothetical protein